VNDALGEVSNMLAGAWKGRLPEFSASCMLSVPAVVSGTNYQLHMQKPDFRLDRGYRFDDKVFSFCIVCDGL
ncbi:MAG: chemotaxis protein CheX, partial [Acetobacteraceae bacterium]|nr:chemotaxis protein CheX [Acetobacteraceae bacterium]